MGLPRSDDIVHQGQLFLEHTRSDQRRANILLQLAESLGDEVDSLADYIDRLLAACPSPLFEDEQVELLFGMVVVMTPLDPSHNMAVYQVRRGLEVGDRATVLCQSSFAASDDSEPEPDVFVVPNDERSWTEHPARAHLVVEIARTSLDRDQGPKSVLYGSSQVEEYWIVNLPEQVVEVYREPHRGRWRSRSLHRRGERVHMQAFPDVSVAVDDVLPPHE